MRAIFIFVHFTADLVLTATWKDVFCSCVDDVNTWRQIFNFSFHFQTTYSNLTPGQLINIFQAKWLGIIEDLLQKRKVNLPMRFSLQLTSYRFVKSDLKWLSTESCGWRKQVTLKFHDSRRIYNLFLLVKFFRLIIFILAGFGKTSNNSELIWTCVFEWRLSCHGRYWLSLDQPGKERFFTKTAQAGFCLSSN